MNTPEERTEIWQFLMLIGQEIELPKNKFKLATEKYNEVGNWLQSGGYLVQESEIHPTGSGALGTTLKPVGGEEFDLDFLVYIRGVDHNVVNPATIKELIGNRLNKKWHATEEDICWRIKFAHDFHMDIVPGIPKMGSNRYFGVHVPSKKTDDWKMSNPLGFVEKFRKIADLGPIFKFTNLREELVLSKNIEQFPSYHNYGYKINYLRRTVQLIKRHRDIYFNKRKKLHLKPASVLITALAMKSYNNFIENEITFIDELDMLNQVTNDMKFYIEGKSGDWLVSATEMQEENFAKDWNDNPDKKREFDSWYNQMVLDFESLPDNISEIFGESVVNKAKSEHLKLIGRVRNIDGLFVTSTGVLTAIPSKSTVRAQPTTIYGNK